MVKTSPDLLSRQSTICELTFPTTILAVKLNRRRLVVVLEERIYVYDISNMKLLHEIETSPNPQAICALSPSSENSYLAYPSPLPSPAAPFASTPPAAPPSANSQSTGDVLLFDAVSLSVTNIIQAHKAPVANLSLNPSGTLLATASDKGTVIRIFSVPNGDKVHEFRRGSYPAKIYSISFNAVSSLLCVSSDTETVHIFKLAKGGDKNGKGGKIKSLSANDGAGDDSNGWYNSRDGSDGQAGGYEAFIDSKKNDGGMGGSLRKKGLHIGRNLAGSVGGFLPGAVSGIWDPQRDFAFLKLPTAGVRSVVALSSSCWSSQLSSTTPQVMVVTSEGLFYSYAIDLENGGECVLQKSYSLLDGTSDDMNGKTFARKDVLLRHTRAHRHIVRAASLSARSTPAGSPTPEGLDTDSDVDYDQDVSMASASTNALVAVSMMQLASMRTASRAASQPSSRSSSPIPSLPPPASSTHANSATIPPHFHQLFLQEEGSLRTEVVACPSRRPEAEVVEPHPLPPAEVEGTHFSKAGDKKTPTSDTSSPIHATDTAVGIFRDRHPPTIHHPLQPP
ncbi:autophagy-related protein 18, partial [Phenoliferia sp. Uapishka_3]